MQLFLSSWKSSSCNTRFPSICILLHMVVAVRVLYGRDTPTVWSMVLVSPLSINLESYTMCYEPTIIHRRYAQVSFIRTMIWRWLMYSLASRSYLRRFPPDQTESFSMLSCKRRCSYFAQKVNRCLRVYEEAFTSSCTGHLSALKRRCRYYPFLNDLSRHKTYVSD